jgi:hypothetical protein
MASSPLSRPWGSGNPQNLLPARQHPLIHSVNHTLSLDPSTNNLLTHSPNTAIQQVQTTQHASNPAQSEIDLSANPRLPFLFQLIPLFYFVSPDFMNRGFIRQLTRRAFGHICGGGARADGRGRGRGVDDSWIRREEKAADYDNNSTRLLMCVCASKRLFVFQCTAQKTFTLIRAGWSGLPTTGCRILIAVMTLLESAATSAPGPVPTYRVGVPRSWRRSSTPYLHAHNTLRVAPAHS